MSKIVGTYYYVNIILFFKSRTVILPSSDEARLVDDAFIKICNMMNDLSMRVRAEAVGLLGSLHHVSPKFLEQTLDKKVMSHLKVEELYSDDYDNRCNLR